MAKKAKPPVRDDRKRRTRAHVIADLSVNFVERLILRCGYVMQRTDADYGIDVWLETFDEQGRAEMEQIPLQLKSTDDIEQYALKTEECFSFPVESKDYQLWCEAIMPVFLILYDAEVDEGYWLHVQDYDKIHKPVIEGHTIKLHIPQQQILGMQTIRMMYERKKQVIHSWKKSQSQGN